MRCGDIIDILREHSPEECAASWDNVGLLAGSRERLVDKVFIALDATDGVIDQAVEAGAQMLLTHHPLLFSPVKRVTEDTLTGRRLIRLIRNDISYYAMHTNFDVLGMAELAAERLGLLDCQILEEVCQVEGRAEGFGRVGHLKEPLTLRELSCLVKERFGLQHVKVFGDLEQTLGRVAVCPGSGKSMMGPALELGAQAIVTGDIGHHEGIDAAAMGLAVIDGGHYGLEHIFIHYMETYLRGRLQGVEITCEEIRNPFEIL